MSAYAIEVHELVREYKKGPRAVDGVSLHVSPGEIYGFLGPNGAGKSTTVKVLVTLLPPSSGRALVGGFDVATQGAQVRAIMGAALQDAALDPLLTAREHFVLQAGLHGLDAHTAQARTVELLDRVALSGAADRKVGTYSGGMKRRLDLALSLVHAPRLVFLDEPTTGLDPQSRAALWDEVRRLAKEQGVTVFLTTQYLEEADVLADRVGIIDHGRIVAEGTPAELKADIGRPTVEVTPDQPGDRARIESLLARFGEPTHGDPNAVSIRLRDRVAPLADIVRALDADRIAIANLVLNAPTLDDVFLAQTGRSLEGGDGEPEPEPGPEHPPQLAEAVAGRSRIEPVPTGLLRDWMAERRVHPAAPVGGPPMLFVRSGAEAGRELVVGRLIALGREGVDFVVDDPEVSRRHCIVRVVEGALVVEDMRSLNGTWVNGHRITAPTLLTPGDRLQLGKTVLEVRVQAGGGTPA